MRWIREITSRAALAAVFMTLVGCPGAQVKEGGDGDVVVKLRRVEVKDASFDEMQLVVIATIENQTAKDLSLEGASASLELVGKGKDRQGDPPMVTSRDEVAAAALKTGSGAGDAAEDGEEGAEEAPAEEPDEPSEEAAADEGADEDGEGGLLDRDVDASGIAGVKTSGTGPSSGRVPAFERTEVPIPMTLKLPLDNTEAMERLVTWRRIVVRVNGEVKYAGKTVDISGPREIVAPNLPIVVLKSAQVASEDNGAQGAAFLDIGLENPNPFTMRVDDFSYAVEVAGKTLREMEGDRETIPPSSLQGFEENFQMTDEIYGADLKKIMQQNTVPYRVWGKVTVRGIAREFEFSGEMQFPR